MADEVACDRSAVVLAGSRGLGRACAEALAASGHRLVLCARDDEQLQKAATEIRNTTGATVTPARVDVSIPGDLVSAFELAATAHNGPDVLVCNAGGPPPGDVRSLTEDDWRMAFELTLMSVVRAVRLAIPAMQARGYGRIVVLGSSSVRHPIPNLALSNVYRPALTGLVKSLAVELGSSGVTINMVSPGRVQTDRVDGLDRTAAAREGIDVDVVRARSVSRIPMQRYGTPAEFAAVVAFLATDGAAYVTGQNILVDGGMVPCLP